MSKPTLIRIVGTILALAAFFSIAAMHRSDWFTGIVGGGLGCAISMAATVIANRQERG